MYSIHYIYIPIIKHRILLHKIILELCNARLNEFKIKHIDIMPNVITISGILHIKLMSNVVTVKVVFFMSTFNILDLVPGGRGITTFKSDNVCVHDPHDDVPPLPIAVHRHTR